MAIVDGERRLTYLDVYNDITAQAWSMFDSEVESKDEFESNVTTSIRKSLTDLWTSCNFPFRERTHIILTRTGTANYALPAGNIIESTINGKRQYSVFCNSKPLANNPDCRYIEQVIGEPEYFYIKQDKICFYPVPDKKYMITVDYMSVYPVLSEDMDEKSTLEEETDYINIPEYLQELFMDTLMPLTMWNYLIAAESDENSSAYKIQYERAFKRLAKYAGGIDKNKTIGWRS